MKGGLVCGRGFFAQILRSAGAPNCFFTAGMKTLSPRSADAPLRHISQGRGASEFGSARPLDFGHWAAHKLEQLSGFRISHAEAVAIGLALDVIYSRNAGHLESGDTERVLALLTKLGFPLFALELLQKDEAGEWAILAGLSEFQQHLGGQLAITLLREIGRGFEVHEISKPGVVEAINELRERFSR